MSHEQFFTGKTETTVTPSNAMTPGEVVTVTDPDGNVIKQFTASLVPKGANRVYVGDRVEYTDATGKHVRGTVFSSRVDPVSGLDVIGVEEDLL